MIEVKEIRGQSPNGYLQIPEWSYDVRKLQNTMPTEFTEHFLPDSKSLASCQQMGYIVIMASFKKDKEALCIVMCL